MRQDRCPEGRQRFAGGFLYTAKALMNYGTVVFTWLGKWLGVELDPVSWVEKGVSLLGGIVSIWIVIRFAQSALELTGASLLIASMGASAVLLFAVPHGSLSQPWPVLAGHGISAIVGVTCARWIPDPTWGAAIAVGLSIGLMHQLKCIHPPGGTTALTAVIGGPSVWTLGYSFVLTPVLVNALVMVVVAIAFNSFFRWRRYPALLGRVSDPKATKPELSHAEIVAALQKIDSFVDITEEDLLRLYQILQENHVRLAAPIAARPAVASVGEAKSSA